MRVRTIAAGVAVAALAGTAVPMALSGTASAKGSGTPTTVTITKCSPAIATIGKTVTIKGTDLTGATKVVIGSTDVLKAGSVLSNTAKAIKVNPVPGGLKVSAPVPVKVVTPNGTATGSCSFKKVKKSKKG